MSVEPNQSRSSSWTWLICAMLLLATMLNYMDRQTLSLTKKNISAELGLSNEQYGWLESGFGFAFACGALLFGALVDRIGVRWLYPLVFLGWSLAGVATGYGDAIGRYLVQHVDAFRDASPAFVGLLVCRTTLGLFEAGHWPCALVTTQRILTRQDRAFGNGLLQSGASVGAIMTPLVIQFMVGENNSAWRGPYVVIGLVGLTWILPWLMLVRGGDIRKPDSLSEAQVEPSSDPRFAVRFFTLVVTVIAINLTWQFYRAWLPSFLGEYHQYHSVAVNWFTSAYFLSTDVGCLIAGYVVRRLSQGGMDVHRSRAITFTFCAVLVFAAGLTAVHLDRGPLLLGMLLLLGAGSLGLFPIYYSLTQEISLRRQGLVTGILGAITWTVTSIMQPIFGKQIDATKSYAFGIQVASVVPVFAALAIVFLWEKGRDEKESPNSQSLQD